MGDCPWLNRPPCPSYDSKKKARVQLWTERLEVSYSPPSTVVSVAQASLVSDATFTTFGAGVKKPMPEGCWPEWFDGAQLGVWDPERDGLEARRGARRESGSGRKSSDRSGGTSSNGSGKQRRVEQGDLRCDKTLPSLPPPTRAPSHLSNHTVTPLPTPDLTLAATPTTSRPSSQPLQSRPQSQPMNPTDLSPRHSDGNEKEKEWYLKPTRNSLALRPASFVAKSEPAAARPKPKPASLKVPYQQLPSNPSLKPEVSQDSRPKSLRPASLNPSSIKTVPVVKKRKPISLRSEDLVAIPDRSSKSASKPRPSSSKPKQVRPQPDPRSSAKYHPLLYESRQEKTRPMSKPVGRTATEARAREEVTRPSRLPSRLVDEEEARLDHIARLMAELEVESSEDEVQQLLAEFRRSRRRQRPVTEAVG